MNINYGTNNYMVRYLQSFLQENYSNTLRVTGEFDSLTHQSLINYLRLPNTSPISDVENKLVEEFSDLNRLFNITRGVNSLYFFSKTINEETSQFIKDNTSMIKDLVSSLGWSLESVNSYINESMDVNLDGAVDNTDRQLIYEHIFGGRQLPPDIERRADLNLDGYINEKDLKIIDEYLNNSKLYIKIKSSGRKNYFPNNEMISMINLFDNKFRYNKAFRDGGTGGNDDQIHDSKGFKLCVIPATSGQKFTIAHGSTDRTKLIIASSPCYEDDLEVLKVQDVVEIELNPGDSYVYTTSVPGYNQKTGATNMETRNLVIQCPSDMGNISGSKTIKEKILLGDLNFDGNIDTYDKKLLSDYVSGVNTNLTKKQLAAANLSQDYDFKGNPIIDMRDVDLLNQVIDRRIPPRYVDYEYEVPSEITTENTNLSKILVIDGEYDKSLAIPFSEFTTNPWIVHDKFTNYLLGMAITPYSNSENITYLQEILKLEYPDYSDNFQIGFFNNTMKELIKRYQNSKYTATKGDLNKDGRIDETDLYLLKEYLAGRKVLTPDQKNLADVNGDTIVDEKDVEIIEKQISGETDELLVYEIPYCLGYLDVQTEAMMLRELQGIGVIRE